MHSNVKDKMPNCLLATEVHYTDGRPYKANRMKTSAGTSE
jgi:hypothetical protein